MGRKVISRDGALDAAKRGLLICAPFFLQRVNFLLLGIPGLVH